MDALGPDLDGLAHGDPHIGVKDIGTLGGPGGVLLKGQGGTGLGGNGLTLCDQGGIRLILFGGAGGEVQAHLGTAHQIGRASCRERVLRLV